MFNKVFDESKVNIYTSTVKIEILNSVVNVLSLSSMIGVILTRCASTTRLGSAPALRH